MSKDTSGPAFPVPMPAGHYWSGETPNGMSIRQWYAGLAMQVLLMNPNSSFKEDARKAFEMADAMIAEGNKQ